MKNQAKRNKDLSVLKACSFVAPVFILVRPQLAENIGMAARAMMNCGFYDMRVVCPKQSPIAEKALAASSGADVILKNAKIYNSLEKAIVDFNFVFATTARSRTMDKKVVLASALDAFFQKNTYRPDKMAILFGCERTGLENKELALADALLTIPLNPEHSSLNLSQAVLLIAYEFEKLLQKGAFKGALEPENPKANKQKIQKFFNFLDELLTTKGYYYTGNKYEKMKTNLNNIFLKAQLSEQEINTLYGVFKHLK